MAASRPAVALSLLCSLFLLCPFSSASAITLPSDSHKVSLTLYYESLCPYSANFIVNYLGKLFEDDLLSIVDLRLVPWGNAKLKGNDTFACQHGPGECLLNTIEACAIDAWPQLNDHFPFIYCVETLVYELKYLEWESCYGKLGLDSKPISDCYSNGLGLKLELQYAAETNALEPPHKYVPWVVVDGQPLYEDYENYISYVCKAYKGAAVPKACSGLSFNLIYGEKLIHPVCYEEIPAPTLLSRAISSVMSWIWKMATSM
ncbi:hypothetical protein QUC31_018366 [Theobroma cacao]|uniref:Thioredoxin superfamily protein isoform 1 n=1 Tax=Theobroma cacao TaxID=3641 RepID=A0A061GYN1_THECC|nr:Thioredoxin superfamily protein isoform 1 [Theobroma cacao]WRX31690.1 Gamma interferon inducible lysosomal thiol reductase GILT - like 5 [Theobroma cacao]